LANPFFDTEIVEVIAALNSSEESIKTSVDFLTTLGLSPIQVSDIPGFIFNRFILLYILEAIDIFEENIADTATIDWTMKSIGNMELGPFELLDLIGIDYVHELTEQIYRATYSDSKFTPSLLLKNMLFAHKLGRKSGRGFYDYDTGFVISEPTEDKEIAKKIFNRIQIVLINEAFNLTGKNIIETNGLDNVYTKGLNFPKGIFETITDNEKSKIKKLLNEYHLLFHIIAFQLFLSIQSKKIGGFINKFSFF